MPSRSRTKKVPPVLKRLRKHFGVDPGSLPVVERQFATYERPNLHLAIEQMLGEKKRSAELIGVLTHHDYDAPSLARLARPAMARNFELGPVEYADVALPAGRQLACVKNGLYLIRDGRLPLALLITQVRHAHPPKLQVEVMSARREMAEDFLRQLQKRVEDGQAFRGHVLSLETDCFRNLQVRHHALPAICRDDLILPDALLDRIERHTLSFTKHADRLRAAGRHIKRGILLYGPPGTGKTLTAMYLVSQMPGRTVLLLTGGAGLQSMEDACRLARLLEPATIVLEDVDLIGTERNDQQLSANALLFELLNQMDGLAEDADLLFVLTTNRPDILEPALAARPGRIDQAIEVPPPDTECRRRLFALYSQGMNVDVADWQRFIDKTAGVTGAFIRELLRKAAVYAAEENGADPLVVQERHLEAGLAELLIEGGPLTKSLLGASVRQQVVPIQQ